MYYCLASLSAFTPCLSSSTITAEANYNGNIATDSITLTYINPITITITSPLDGATISRPDVMVQGIIINSTANETGVTVNGIIANVYGDQFVVNHVPLEEGDNTITATATDTDGNMETVSINVNAVTTGDYISITANTESGISPLETTLRVDGSFSFTEEPTITYDGPGQVEFLESPTDNEYKVRITTEGIYYFTAEVMDDESNTYADSVAIVVLDKEELDALLKAKWGGMKTALANKDIENALKYFAENAQELYSDLFTALYDSLPQIVQELGDIQFIGMMENSAEYDIRTVRDDKEYSFYLLFVRDEDGLWKISSF